MSDKKQNVKEKKKKYKDYIVDVTSNVCKKITYPQKNDYVKAIVEIKNEVDGVQDQPYTTENLRSGISKALDSLVSEGKYLCMKNEAGKLYYVPNCGKYKQRYHKDRIFNDIKDKVTVVDKDILIVSYNVCAIKVAPIGDVKIKKLFEDCLEGYCYHILKNQTFVYITLRSQSELLEIPNEKSDEYVVIKALGQAIRKLYNIQNNIPNKKTKIKLSKINEE